MCLTMGKTLMMSSSQNGALDLLSRWYSRSWIWTPSFLQNDLSKDTFWTKYFSPAMSIESLHKENIFLYFYELAISRCGIQCMRKLFGLCRTLNIFCQTFNWMWLQLFMRTFQNSLGLFHLYFSIGPPLPHYTITVPVAIWVTSCLSCSVSWHSFKLILGQRHNWVMIHYISIHTLQSLPRTHFF